MNAPRLRAKLEIGFDMRIAPEYGQQPPRRVGVVGSGLAGLTVAYLLQRDPRHRYAVTILESGSRLSLDSASISVPADDRPSDGHQSFRRIDVPMRGFTGGYYNNLFALYRHLEIPFERKRFRFAFAALSNDATNNRDQTYFIHASDNHQIPPPRPPGVGLLTYLLELFSVVFCFAYFTFCCQFIRPEFCRDGTCETFDSYLSRIQIPRSFIQRYLLPLTASIATCSHEELLGFPASDIVNYRRRIVNGKQFVVTGGVCSVEKSLVRGISDIRTNAHVLRVEALKTGVRVVTRIENGGGVSVGEDIFDEVILATPPSIAASIFAPASPQLQKIPVRTIKTIVHKISHRSDPESDNSRQDQIEDIRLRTITTGQSGSTEATHIQYGQFAVTSCPLRDPCEAADILATAQFTRTLRSPSSQRIVKQIFSHGPADADEKDWRNGTDHVWMVGAWCWDGMVLLEGAVVSSMRVAEALNVEVPWHEARCSRVHFEERTQFRTRWSSWWSSTVEYSVRRLVTCYVGGDKQD